jgi:hypothetical protein
LSIAPRPPSGVQKKVDVDDVVVRVAALHADVVRLVVLLDHLDAVRHQPVPEGADGGGVGQHHAEVHHGARSIGASAGPSARAKPRRS